MFEFGTIRSLSGTEIYKLKLKTRKKLGIYQFQDTLFEYTPLWTMIIESVSLDY